MWVNYDLAEQIHYSTTRLYKSNNYLRKQTILTYSK